MKLRLRQIKIKKDYCHYHLDPIKPLSDIGEYLLKYVFQCERLEFVKQELKERVKHRHTDRQILKFFIMRFKEYKAEFKELKAEGEKLKQRLRA